MIVDDLPADKILDKVREEHDDYEHKIRSAADHALMAGKLLLGLVGDKNTDWRQCVEKSLPGGERQARRYMQLYINWQAVADRRTAVVRQMLMELADRDDLPLFRALAESLEAERKRENQMLAQGI